MKIDLKKDSQRIKKYIANRAKDYPKYVNAGPGEDDDEIRLITLGFSYDQSGWIALVFDTRPDADSDGEWQSYIAQNEELFDGWFEAFSDMTEQGAVLSITKHDGTRRSFTEDSAMEEIAECFGVMCRERLEQARESGVFKKLPLADNCRLAVEEHEGYYGWIEGGYGYEEDEDQVMQSMLRTAKKLSKPQKIEYWIGQLDRLAAGKSCEAGKLISGDEFVLEHLQLMSKDAIVPLLNWANTWAGKREFKPPEKRKAGEDCEYPHAGVLYQVFRALDDWGIAPAEAEPLIQQYIRTAIKVKPIREIPAYSKSKKPVKLYGIVPTHAAFILHHHYEDYPTPLTDANTNELRNADEFVGKARKKTKSKSR